MRNVATGIIGKIVLGGALVGIVATGTGCKKLLQKVAKYDAGVDNGGGEGESSDPEERADDQLQAKVDEYIQHCTNALSSSIIRSRNRYYDWVDPKVGVTGKERSVYGLYDLPKDGPAECAKAVAKAKAMPPSNAKLEAAADAFSKAASDLGAVIPTAVKYYDNKDFKDDQFAKAKEFHPKLIAAWTAFGTANHDLHEAIDGITKPIAQRELARIEKQEGKKFTYHRKRTLNTARELVEAGDPEDRAVDFPLYESAFKEFDAALTDLETYGSAHKADLDDPKLRKTVTASTGYSRFTDTADEFRKESKGYMRCLRDAPAKAKDAAGKVKLSELPKCSDGDDVIDKYNSFIQTSNSWQF